MKKKKRQPKRQGPKLPRSVRRSFPGVEEVVDATKAVEVTVTARDSSDGRRMRSTECAMARAAKREYDADGVIIGLTTSYIIKGKKAIRFQTTGSVAREIVSFDRHHDFAAGKYELVPKSPANRLGVHSPTPKGSHGPKDQPRIVHHETARVRQLERGSK